MKKKNEKQCGNLSNYIILPVRYGGIYGWLSGASRLLVGILPLAEVWIVAEFVDRALYIVQNQGNIADIYMIAVCLGITIGLSWLVGKMAAFADAKLIYRLREKFRPCLIEKCARLNYADIENEHVQDQIRRVTKEPEKELYSGFQELLTLLAVAIRTLGLVGIITAKLWWCGVIVLFLHLPILYFAKKNGENAYQADKDFSLHMRRYEYLNEVLTGRESAMERSLFRYSEAVHGMWQKQYGLACAKYIKAFFKYFFAARMYSIFSVLASLLMVLFLLGPVFTGDMSVGLFIAVVSSLLTMVSVTVQQLSQNIRELSRKKAYMQDLQEFMGMEEEPADILERPAKVFQGFQTMEFQNVSFKYPGTDVYVLKNMSFTLESGKHYAVVGENAAGKTTVTKLMLGLYRDYEGKILINGKELREYSVLELKGLYAVVYQDFARYHISVKENLAIGGSGGLEKISALTGSVVQNSEQERSEQAEWEEKRTQEVLQELGLWDEVQKMPDQADTILGKFEADDREISVGQWQRIAIGRALMSEAPIRILDEPSAALDPVSESRIYEEYGKLSKGKTTIFITHRLGSVKLADHILVFRKGTLEAQGTYAELMKSCELFKTMYETQRGDEK